MSYHGFVEGDDIGKGTVDVVVTEGFSGNIALKTAEGTARQIADYLRAAMSRTLMARIGYIFAKGAFDFLREKMDPAPRQWRRFPRAERHRGEEPWRRRRRGLRCGDRTGYDMVRNRLLDRIEADLDLFHARYPQTAGARDGRRRKENE